MTSGRTRIRASLRWLLAGLAFFLPALGLVLALVLELTGTITYGSTLALVITTAWPLVVLLVALRLNQRSAESGLTVLFLLLGMALGLAASAWVTTLFGGRASISMPRGGSVGSLTYWMMTLLTVVATGSVCFWLPWRAWVKPSQRTAWLLILVGSEWATGTAVHLLIGMPRAMPIHIFSGIATCLFVVLAWSLVAPGIRANGRSKCQHCEYDLTGLTSPSTCPECGASVVA